MRRCFVLAAAGLAALALPAPSMAESIMEGHAHGCPAGTAAALPPELASWADRQPLKAAGAAGKADAAALEIGKAVDAALLPTPDVKYAIRPEKPGGSVSFGGLFAFTVAEAGTFRVALGSGAWIDLVKDGVVIDSVAHGHGPECSDVRKMVDFPLAPGRYILQIAANGQAQLPLLVTRLP